VLLESDQSAICEIGRWRLLDAARDYDGNNLLWCTDADELISPALFRSFLSAERDRLVPGTVSKECSIHLWGRVDRCRDDNSSYAPYWKEFGLVDDRKADFDRSEALPLHQTRVPFAMGNPDCAQKIFGCSISSGSSSAKTQFKQAWYRCSELLDGRKPSTSTPGIQSRFRRRGQKQRPSPRNGRLISRSQISVKSDKRGSRRKSWRGWTSTGLSASSHSRSGTFRSCERSSGSVWEGGRVLIALIAFRCRSERADWPDESCAALAGDSFRRSSSVQASLSHGVDYTGSKRSPPRVQSRDGELRARSSNPALHCRRIEVSRSLRSRAKRRRGIARHSRRFQSRSAPVSESSPELFTHRQTRHSARQAELKRKGRIDFLVAGHRTHSFPRRPTTFSGFRKSTSSSSRRNG
jgi:hypothetical protein